MTNYKINFCTLFDSGYLSRGLALHKSLEKTCKNYHLYIFAFDKKCEVILKKLNLNNVTVISLSEFEDSELLSIKKERTRAEYCWTCSSSTILYCINKYKLKNCTYLDSDIYFFDDPRKLINEVGINSVLITPHNYSKKYDQSKISGKYCVQFVYFRNDLNGMKVLSWWRNSCLRWCFNRVEDGKFGDQKYLDLWQKKFSGVKETDNFGAGVAPWNVQQVKEILTNKNETILILNNNRKYTAIFYHFHSMRFYKLFSKFWYSSTKNYAYDIDHKVSQRFYDKYFDEVLDCNRKILKVDKNFNMGFGKISEFLTSLLVNILRNVKIVLTWKK